MHDGPSPSARRTSRSCWRRLCLVGIDPRTPRAGAGAGGFLPARLPRIPAARAFRPAAPPAGPAAARAGAAHRPRRLRRGAGRPLRDLDREPLLHLGRIVCAAGEHGAALLARLLPDLPSRGGSPTGRDGDRAGARRSGTRCRRRLGSGRPLARGRRPCRGGSGGALRVSRDRPGPARSLPLHAYVLAVWSVAAAVLALMAASTSVPLWDYPARTFVVFGRSRCCPCSGARARERLAASAARPDRGAVPARRARRGDSPRADVAGRGAQRAHHPGGGIVIGASRWPWWSLLRVDHPALPPLHHPNGARGDPAHRVPCAPRPLD